MAMDVRGYVSFRECTSRQIYKVSWFPSKSYPPRWLNRDLSEKTRLKGVEACPPRLDDAETEINQVS